MKSIQKKPYDVFPPMERLREHGTMPDSEERHFLQTAVALTASDPQAVSLYVDLSGDNWANIYPPIPQPEPISTGKAIETFLDTYGKTSPKEEALLERLIFNPVPQYSEILERQDEEERRESDPEDTELLADDTDIAAMAKLAHTINETATDSNNEQQTQARHQEKTKHAPTTPLSLELAKIFVKQGHFDRAYEIISKISLNNPEKSVYFADQLRFLEKLIKIQQAKK